MRLKKFSPFAVVMGLAVTTAAAQANQAGADGSAQVREGAKLYDQHCSLCHGAKGRDATVFPRPIWGPGHDIAKFGNSKGLFEYLQLMMPFDNPQKIGDADKLAIAAFLLERNGNMKADMQLPAGGGTIPIK